MSRRLPKGKVSYRVLSMYGLPGITVLWAGVLLLDAVWEPLGVWRSILLSLTILLFLALRSRIAFRAQPAGPWKKGFFVIGLANCVTLCRGLLICGLGGFILSPHPQGFLVWVPAIIYTAATAADGLDGLIARARTETSPAGEVLDREVDGLGTLVAGLLAYQYGRLPAFYLPVSGAYYLFNLVTWACMKRGKPLRPLLPSTCRRAVGAFQAICLAFFLTPLFGPTEGSVVAVVLALIISASFLRDWMAVVGTRRRSH